MKKLEQIREKRQKDLELKKERAKSNPKLKSQPTIQENNKMKIKQDKELIEKSKNEKPNNEKSNRDRLKSANKQLIKEEKPRIKSASQIESVKLLLTII
jgi:hypothetical protein